MLFRYTEYRTLKTCIYLSQKKKKKTITIIFKPIVNDNYSLSI